MSITACLRILLVLALSTGAAWAHDRSESTSHWTFADGELRGVITVRTREVTRLALPGDTYATLPQIFVAHVRRSIAAAVDGAPCLLSREPAAVPSEPGFTRVEMSMQCKSGAVLSVTSDLLFTVAPSHHHFIYVEAGDARREGILTGNAPTLDLELRSAHAAQTHFLQFITMGIGHIATGIDHLAFLLALLISARNARQILAIVTGFTIGHSLTLSLAVLGLLQPNRPAVECLIGLTIALAAAQNLVRGEREGRVAAGVAFALGAALLLIPSQLRPGLSTALIVAVAIIAASSLWLTSTRREDTPTLARFTMAVGFGLIHGMGFAGALQDLHLPRSLLVPTLLGFNLGVEIGQLAVVAIAIGCAALVRAVLPVARRSEAPAALLSATLLAAGLTWFLTRAVVVS